MNDLKMNSKQHLLSEAAENCAIRNDYDIATLIEILCDDEEKRHILPFVKHNGRLKRNLTCGNTVYRKDEVTPTYEFQYNTKLFPFYIRQCNLDVHGVADFLAELATIGYSYLKKNVVRNCLSGIKVDRDKLAKFDFSEINS